MSARAQLALEAQSLDAGQSVRMVCPFCGGGSSAEKSLVLTQSVDGALLFVCHRSHCGASGRLGGGTRLPDPARSAPVRRGPPVPYPELIAPLDSEVSIYLGDRWHFENVPPHWRWHSGLKRVMMPVMSPTWVRRGWVARVYGMSRYNPKTLNYKEIYDQPWLHWAGTGGDEVVVVEDIPSAERLVRHDVAACALMGTHMADDVASEIIEVAKRRPVVVALDRDAVGKSMEIGRRLQSRCAGVVKSWVLPQDIKDMTPEVLDKWVSGSY